MSQLLTSQPPQSSGATTAAIGDDRHFRVDSDVRAFAVSDDNMWLAHHDGDVTIRNTRTTDLVHTIRSAPAGGRVWSMVVVPYGVTNTTSTSSAHSAKHDEVWLGLSNGTIDVYDAVRFEKLHSLLRHTGGIYTLTEYGGYVYSGSNDFTIVMWSAERHRSVRQLCGHSSYVRCLYAEGSLVISGSDDHTIRVWEVPSGKVLQVQHFHHSGVSSLARVGQHVWSGDDLGQICVWALGTYELLLKNEKAHSSRITAVKKVGSRVYIGSTDRKVSIWDAYGKKPLRVMEDHQSWITCIACPSVLSRYYVWSAGADGAVRCWHHDEYKIMSGDAERFDDVRWYYTMHPPGQEQTTALLDQIHHQDHQLVQWKQEADAFRCEASKSTQESELLSRRMADLLEECAKQKARADGAETLLATKTNLLAVKETELTALSSKSVDSVTEVGALKVQLESVTAKLREEQRRADQAVAEKVAADSLLLKLRELKAEEAAGGRPGHGGTAQYLPLLILNTPSEVGSSVIALHHDIRSLLQLNEVLRDEVERYKGVLGIKTNTPYPILKLASLAEDRLREGVALYVVPTPPPASAATSTTTSTAAMPAPSQSTSVVGGTPVAAATPITASTSVNTAAPKPLPSSTTTTTGASTSSSAAVTADSGLQRIPSIVANSAPAPSVPAPQPQQLQPTASGAAASVATKPLVPAPPVANVTPIVGTPHYPAAPTRPIVIQQQTSYGAFTARSAAGTSVAEAAAGTSSVVVVAPSQPLFTIDAQQAALYQQHHYHQPQHQHGHHGGGVVAGTTFEELHGGAQWLKTNVADYVQERYHRKVTPLFGPPVVTTSNGGSVTTPRRDVSPRLVSPRSHGRSSVRPATASGFGSSTTRKYF